MDARTSAAAIAFILTFNLSFVCLRVQATGDCSRTLTTVPIDEADAESQQVPCFDFFALNPTWTIGSDICNTVPYEHAQCRAGAPSCHVLSSDFLERGPTFICCGDDCGELKINPVVKRITVPPVIQAGKEATIYTTFAAKPRPPDTDIPSLTVEVRNGSEQNGSAVDTSMRIIPRPTNRTEYIIVHTFVVPLDLDDGTTVRPTLALPDGWAFPGESTFEPIGVIFPDVEPPTTTPATDAGGTPTAPGTETAVPMTSTNLMETTTATPDVTANEGAGTTTVPSSATGGMSSNPTCIAIGHLAAAIVVSMAIPVIVFTALACVCVYCFWHKKKRRESICDKKEPETSKKLPPPQTNGFVRSNALRASLSLQVHPSAVITHQISTPTPGYGETPADETTGLLPPSSRNHAAGAAAAAAAISPAPAPVTGAINPGYHSSPTTPYSPGDPMRPLLERISSREPGDPVRPLLARNSSCEPSAAAAASTHTSSDGDVNSDQGGRDEHEATADELAESDRHIYDELKPPFKRPLPKVPETAQLPDMQPTIVLQTPPAELPQQTIDPTILHNNIIQSGKPESAVLSLSENDKQFLQALILNHTNTLQGLTHATDHDGSSESVDESSAVYYRGGEEVILPPQPEVTSKV